MLALQKCRLYNPTLQKDFGGENLRKFAETQFATPTNMAYGSEMNEIRTQDNEQVTELHSEVHNLSSPARLLLYLCLLLGVKLSYTPLLEVSRVLPRLLLFISLLAVVMVETAIAVNRGSTAFESVHWKLTKKAIISVATWDIPAGCCSVRNQFWVDFHR